MYRRGAILLPFCTKATELQPDSLDAVFPFPHVRVTGQHPHARTKPPAEGSKLSSVDGEVDVLLDGGALEVLAGEQLRRLRVVGGGGGDSTAAKPIAIHMPEKLAAGLKGLPARFQFLITTCAAEEC